MVSMYIKLSLPAAKELHKLAQQERRELKEQAAYLVEEALKHRGLLPKTPNVQAIDDPIIQGSFTKAEIEELMAFKLVYATHNFLVFLDNLGVLEDGIHDPACTSTKGQRKNCDCGFVDEIANVINALSPFEYRWPHLFLHDKDWNAENFDNLARAIMHGDIVQQLELIKRFRVNF